MTFPQILTGFTQWSSNREPNEVFTLLETIYGSFDALTKRRKVFKVETIGDCYGKFIGKLDRIQSLLVVEKCGVPN